MSEIQAALLAITGFVGELAITGGVAVAFAYWAFRTFSERWLQSRFDEKLEAYRHENAKELSRLRVNIDGALDATIRIQEKEFQVLSECWQKLNVAHGAVFSFVSLFKQYPDFSRMNEDEKLAYLDQLDLRPFQKEEIMKSSNPLDKLKNIIFWKENHRANQCTSDFKNYLIFSEVFMDEIFASQFKEVSRDLIHCIIEHEISENMNGRHKDDKSWDSLNKEINPKVELLANEIRKKMYRHSHVSAWEQA
jgi:hypothetical protein